MSISATLFKLVVYIVVDEEPEANDEVTQVMKSFDNYNG